MPGKSAGAAATNGRRDMAVNGIGGGSESVSQAAAPVVAKTGNNALNKDDFMKLLTAQLKNQDPNSPVDAKEMVTQLSQLTSVEKLQEMSTKLDMLTAATNSGAANSSASLIGKTVTGVADTAQLGATGPTKAAVNLKQDAANVKVSVVNSAGRVVAKLDLGALKAGAQEINWKGLEDSGDRAAQGIYTFQVSAKDANGTDVEASQSITGTVNGVFYENGKPELDVNGVRVPMGNLTSISQPAASIPTATK
ncbi:MAG TPA: flagellar hook capping FlgD N-terminal domain-containing protein [Polyangiales bacterium]|nr:flagellar hook capping FlgD N-terminal domain-containing protein [Polyangiales bacterium]